VIGVPAKKEVLNMTDSEVKYRDEVGVNTVEFSGDGHMPISILALYINAVTKIYPPQYVKNLNYNYDSVSDRYFLEIETTREAYPGQFNVSTFPRSITGTVPDNDES
jgi:hypothetical protein